MRSWADSSREAAATRRRWRLPPCCRWPDSRFWSCGGSKIHDSRHRNHMLNFEQWTTDLSRSITDALRDFRSKVNDEMAVFAVDCAPWNGVIVLAFLTQPELNENPILSEPSEMAAWRYYDFGARLPFGQSVSIALGSHMRTTYEQAGENRGDMANQFFRACANAAASEPVIKALSHFSRTAAFRITIPHPDTNEEYYPPSAN